MLPSSPDDIDNKGNNPVLLQAGSTDKPIFFVHGFGGGVDAYYELARLLGPEQTAYGLKPKGMEDGLEPDRTIPEIARYTIGLMQSIQPHGPYFLAGYSYGGTIAYEIACQLERMHEPVGLLAVIESSFHDAYRTEYRFWHPSRILGFLANLPFWMHDFLMLDRYEMITVVVRRIMRVKKWFAEKINWTSNVTELDLVGRMVYNFPESVQQLMLIHMEASNIYCPPKYGGHVTVMRVRAQPLFAQKDRDLGWGMVAAGGAEVVFIPGSHSSLLQAPYVFGLASCLKEKLEQASR
jgi:thioesterase domain-containing protein